MSARGRFDHGLAVDARAERVSRVVLLGGLSSAGGQGLPDKGEVTVGVIPSRLGAFEDPDSADARRAGQVHDHNQGRVP